jgi:hypothetical protein
MDSDKLYIFLVTLSKVSLEKVDATYNKEAIGLEFPSLAN